MNDEQQKARHRLVIIESPYAGDIAKHVDYARACVRDSLLRGEAPIASHLLYTQPGILRDEIPEERSDGIAAGLAWRDVAEATIVYTDMGISRGMAAAIDAAKAAGSIIEYRSIEKTGSEPAFPPVSHVLPKTSLHVPMPAAMPPRPERSAIEASLREILSRFKSAIGGGGEVEGDMEAIAAAEALLSN
jgi:hypothetical protein